MVAHTRARDEDKAPDAKGLFVDNRRHNTSSLSGPIRIHTYLSLAFAVCQLLECASAKMAFAFIRKRPALRPVGKERSLALQKLAEHIIATALILANLLS